MMLKGKFQVTEIQNVLGHFDIFSCTTLDEYFNNVFFKQIFFLNVFFAQPAKLLNCFSGFLFISVTCLRA